MAQTLLDIILRDSQGTSSRKVRVFPTDFSLYSYKRHLGRESLYFLVGWPGVICIHLCADKYGSQKYLWDNVIWSQYQLLTGNSVLKISFNGFFFLSVYKCWSRFSTINFLCIQHLSSEHSMFNSAWLAIHVSFKHYLIICTWWQKSKGLQIHLHLSLMEF